MRCQQVRHALGEEGMTDVLPSPFNSALETGVRTLAILIACYPTAHDLGRLVQYDYLTVHSGDANGPPSLHPPLPLRSGELLVRRGLIESGLRLMMSRSLVRTTGPFTPTPALWKWEAVSALVRSFAESRKTTP